MSLTINIKEVLKLSKNPCVLPTLLSVGLFWILGCSKIETIKFKETTYESIWFQFMT